MRVAHLRASARWFRVAVVLLTVSAALPALADEPPTSGEGPVDLLPFGRSLDRPRAYPRLDGRLASMVAGAPSGAGPVREGYAPGARVSVEIFPAEGQADAVEASLRADGATNVVRIGQVVAADLPVSSLSRIAADPRIDWTQSASVPVAEAITGEGVAFTGADLWHAAGFTGAGVDIAVIDLGFAGYSGLLGAELPALVQTADFCGGRLTTGTDHGTAVAEIVHEVAPDATLHLVCIDTLADLSQAITYSVGAGVTIINHSVGWFNQGRGDGSGAMQPIVQAARDAGILWVNSGGNYADKHWSGTFSDTDSDGFHNFVGADWSNTVLVPAGTWLSVFLRWDVWPTSSVDYDLALYDSNLNLVDWSWDVQSGTQPPTEGVFAFNASPTTAEFHIGIVKISGPATTPRMDLFTLGGLPEYVNAAGSLAEPAVSPLVTAVGAVDVGNGLIEGFSSQGPTIDGRVKPDVSAPDRVSGSTYGAGGFDGTSAAAPHAAGLAALLLERNPSLSPTQLAALIETVATDAGPVGPDNTYGEGVLFQVAPIGPPIVDAGPDAPALAEGSFFQQGGSFTDPGGSSWLATVDYGDGSGVQALGLAGTSFSLSHAYADDGVFPVEVCVTDNDSDTGCDQLQATVANVLPQVDVGADDSIAPGLPWTRSGSFVDPGADTWTATVDWGDGAGPEPLTLVGKTFDLAQIWGTPGVRTVTVTVTDDEGGIGSGSAQVTVGSGLLRVVTSPAVGSQILVDGVPMDTWGLNWVKLAPGSYALSFTDLEGFSTPGDQTVTVTEGVTTEVTGVFPQRGLLRVVTSPPVPATISVDGVPRNDWGMWTDLAPGDYQVCFGDVASFTAPACQAATVTAGETTAVTGTYVSNPGAVGPVGHGMLRMTTSPAVPSQILVDGVARDTWGLNWMKLPPGSYEVSFRDVAGFTTPDPQTITVNGAATTEVTGAFTPRGWLRVTTSPPVPATISVGGIPRNDWGMWTDLEAASYDVCFGDAAGFTTPACQVADVTAGTTAQVTGTYN